jgi:methionyl aminopeptidase
VILLKSRGEIDQMRRPGEIVAGAHQRVRELVCPGMTTGEIDRAVEEFIRDAGGNPAFKGYRGFPAAACVSVNDEVVHGIPGRRALAEGDIVGVDIGVLCGGFYGDAAQTLPVGRISPEAERLLAVTCDALYAGIEQARVGNRVGDISHAIQVVVEAAGFSVVRDLVGHGIGRSMHEEPQVPNFGRAGVGPRLQAGMTLALEPMVNAGDYAVEVMTDQWTWVTKDGSLSAHFEHSVAVTEDGPVILTEGTIER